MAEPRR